MINFKTGEVITRKLVNRENWLPDKEPNNGISLTLPDQNLPIRTLIERYARGIPVPTKEPIWEGEENDLPDPARMDYAERQEYAQKYAEEFLAIKQAFNENKASQEAKNALKIDSTLDNQTQTTKTQQNETNSGQPGGNINTDLQNGSK